MGLVAAVSISYTYFSISCCFYHSLLLSFDFYRLFKELVYQPGFSLLAAPDAGGGSAEVPEEAVVEGNLLFIQNEEVLFSCWVDIVGPLELAFGAVDLLSMTPEVAEFWGL